MKNISNREWAMIILAVVLLVLIVISWERISFRISQVWDIYTNVDN